MVDIEDIKARLSKETLNKIRLASEIDNTYIPTPSLGLNMTVRGFGIGKQTTLFGNQSAGKSTIAIQSAAIAQLQGRGVGYFDVERTFDPLWAKRLGMDCDAAFISQISSIGEYADIANDWIKAGIEFVVVDSTSELLANSFFDGDEIKAFADTNQVGQFSKDLGKAGGMIQGTNYSAAIVHIAQIRKQFSQFIVTTGAKQGHEVEHADSLRLRLFSSNSEKQRVMGSVQYGNNVFEEMIGRKVTWSVDKNKVNGHYDTGTFDLYFRGDEVGIDKFGELIEYGKKFGIVEGTTWLTIYGEKMQGTKNAVKHLRENPQVAEKLEAEILAQSI